MHSDAPGSAVKLAVLPSTALAIRARLPLLVMPPLLAGLGLSAVRGIVRSHAGALHVRSAPGRGTTFTLLWPAVGAPPHEAPPEPTDADWQASGAVLVIDDDAEVRAVAAQMLSRLGYSAHLAESGPAGLALLDTLAEQPVAVLLDLTMPGLRGDEVFALIQRRRGDVPIILMSGYDEQDVVRRFVGHGLAGFVQKPFSQHDLQRILQQAQTHTSGG
jgi:CheY-like chemotaxis protein